MELEIQVQKMNIQINNLRTKCVSKSAEIRKLKNRVNRLSCQANTLNELLEDLKEKNLLPTNAEKELQVSKAKSYILHALLTEILLKFCTE